MLLYIAAVFIYVVTIALLRELRGEHVSNNRDDCTTGRRKHPEMHAAFAVQRKETSCMCVRHDALQAA